MDSERLSDVCHVVAMPYPGRGHINPIMNFCKLLVSRKNDILITFVVTEEWLGFIGSDPKPDNIRFSSIPNVIPSDKLKSLSFNGFYEAVITKMGAPFEQLLDRLQPPVNAIIGDIEIFSPIRIANQRNIPVASFWTMSASFFSMLYRYELCAQNQPLRLTLLEHEDSIPGISSAEVDDLRTIIHRDDPRMLELALECISNVQNSQYLLFNSVYELEHPVIDALKLKYAFPVDTIGPAIPYVDLNSNSYEADYLQWLNKQTKNSVLYISLGSFLTVPKSQMDEILAGLRKSGVRFLWVARDETTRLNELIGDDRIGCVVEWCDQLKVLRHSSVGGFWTHCGWNSTLEGVYAGVHMLTLPLFLDQDSNSRKIVEEWKIGKMEKLVKRDEIAEIVKRFMDLENNEMRKRASEIGGVCQQAVAQGGSSIRNLDHFIRDFLVSP